MAKIPTLLPVVAGALINGDGQILMQKRPEGRAMAGLWEFPGGKIDEGEGPDAALVRELDEELGVRIDPADLCAGPFASEPLGDRHLLLCLYLTRRWHGEPQSREGQEIGWFAPDELAGLEMPPADYPLVEQLLKLL